MPILPKFIVGGILATVLYTAVAPETLTCYKEIIKPIKESEIHCLATNVYHEARGEPWLGQLMVARVTLNRVRTTICDAVYAPNQFSWTLSPTKVVDKTAYEIALAAAQAASFVNSPATHFHTTNINPSWAKKLIKLQTIGNHVFYY